MKKLENKNRILKLLEEFQKIGLSQSYLVELKCLAVGTPNKKLLCSVLDKWAEDKKIGCHILSLKRDLIHFMELELYEIFSEGELDNLLQTSKKRLGHEFSVWDIWSRSLKKDDHLFAEICKEQLLLFIRIARTGNFSTVTAIILEM
ncbi:MAG: hypothetical protein LBH96_01210 [Candidatus Peribacteria bacterium]|jgi:hypothetical protein|nr:hypothetical protein [Candidatus Peribacteria bacterium]